ncbi:MAG: HD domain-containing phosphohydrolase [Thermoanaerobaculia bacterium]
MPSSQTDGFRRVLLHGRPVGELLSLFPEEGLQPRPLRPESLRFAADEVAVLLCDPSVSDLLAAPPPAGLGEGADRVGVLLLGNPPASADPFWSTRLYFSLPEEAAAEHLARAVRSLFRILEERVTSARARRSLAERTEETRALVGVGVALAAETDRDRLLETILTQARALTQADAGSLYLVESADSGQILKFVRAQNDSVRFEFVERTLPLEDSSIAGFVARSGRALNLADVSKLPPAAPYRFDSGFDKKYGYRSRSMLTVPMKTPQGRTIGVLQLLNRKKRVVPDPTVTAFIRVETVPFDDENEDIARSLAAQAAVAVENRRLTESIRRLFEGFVEASVTAIEQRDPTTSGHSERVALLSCGLAQIADRADTGRYASFRITPEQLRELRYAAVLHDFGKVGVRESVLVKARKLFPWERDLLRSRFDQAILSAAAETWEKAAREKWSDRQVYEALAARQGELDRAWRSILRADEPSLLPAEVSAEVARLSEFTYRNASGADGPLVLSEEIALLSIPKGSLTPRERREIESHVTQSFRFLTRIPWTPDLAHVPDWAYAHHEKLDGSGYPQRLRGEEILAPVRIVTISDIFDALAARDRPYKKAVSSDKALDILRAEAGRGSIDADLLELFIDGKVYINALKKT